MGSTVLQAPHVSPASSVSLTRSNSLTGSPCLCLTNLPYSLAASFYWAIVSIYFTILTGWPCLILFFVSSTGQLSVGLTLYEVTIGKRYEIDTSFLFINIAPIDNLLHGLWPAVSKQKEPKWRFLKNNLTIFDRKTKARMITLLRS